MNTVSINENSRMTRRREATRKNGAGLEVPEPCAGKLALLVPFFRDTVLRGRKLPGAATN
jgi:hypothetical protein